MQLYSPAPTDCHDCPVHTYDVASQQHFCQFSFMAHKDGMIPPMIDGRLRHDQGLRLAGWTNNQPITPPDSCPIDKLPAKGKP